MSEEKLWCVYKHTNKLNGKVYIGKTCRKPEYRWNEGRGYMYQRHFWNAIQKYGWDNFEHVVLVTDLDADAATALERSLISQHDSMNPAKGYNQTAGGEGMLGWHHTDESRAKIIESNRTRTISEATRKKQSESQKRHIAETGIVSFRGRHHTEETKRILSEKASLRAHPPLSEEAKQKISKANKGRIKGPMSEEQKKRISAANMGHPVSEETRRMMSIRSSGENNPMYGKVPSTAREVVQYSLDGVELARYVSASHAKKVTGISNASIGNCCKGNAITAGGFLWSYSGEEPIIPTGEKRNRTPGIDNFRPIHRFSTSGELIWEYDDVFKAVQQGLDRHKVIAACRRNTETYKKSIWRFADDADDVLSIVEALQEKLYRKYEGRHILRFSLDGDFIDAFVSVADAAAKTGLLANNIAACCKRTAKTCGASFFFYEKDVSESFLNEAIEALVRDAKSVVQFDKTGKFINEYRTAEEAATAIGVSATAVYYNCNMETLLTKGYIFLFAGDNQEAKLEEKLKGIAAGRKPRPSRRKSYLNKNATSNILSEKYPGIAAQWHPTKNGTLSPDSVLSGSGKLVWWIDELGHEWQSTVGNRTSQSLGCPFCGNQRLLKGFNDLETRFPELCEEWDFDKNGDLSPGDVLYGSGQKVWWRCRKCGHEWQTRIQSRINGSGCPKCKK